MGKIHIRENTNKICYKITQKDKHKNSIYNGKYNRKIPHKEKTTTLKNTKKKKRRLSTHLPNM